MLQVQTLTREKRVEFARMKDNTIQKIEILAASRINLLSARLEEYHLSYQKYLQSSINALQEVYISFKNLISRFRTCLPDNLFALGSSCEGTFRYKDRRETDSRSRS